MAIRKILYIHEHIQMQGARALNEPLTRVAGIAVVDNPFAGRFVEDLSPLFDVGLELGESLATRMAAMLDRPIVSYGKGAVVGLAGEVEHGAAILHPKLGKPMRAAIGGGEAIISSNVKLGVPGTTIDVPLANKDNIWSFNELDTMTVSVADAPLPDEIVVVLVLANRGRPFARVGAGRATT